MKVATIEGKALPWYGTQYHPEKNRFEWPLPSVLKNIPHDPAAVAFSAAVADFFVSLARRNSNAYDSIDDESRLMIWNHPITFNGFNAQFMQTYTLNGSATKVHA